MLSYLLKPLEFILVLAYLLLLRLPYHYLLLLLRLVYAPRKSLTGVSGCGCWAPCFECRTFWMTG